MRKAREGESWFASVSTSLEPHNRIPVSEVNALCGVIEHLTSSLCAGGGGNFSTDSIVIDLVSPDACDLTVVDLPGIIRTVTAGQSVSVIDQVNNLIKSFLIDKRTIILAVIPANQVQF
jgi:interferon-induced GTP-binding protein Mx1